MDVTPGPRLRRRITAATETLNRFDADKAESLAYPGFPAPDWQAYAMELAVALREILALVRP